MLCYDVRVRYTIAVIPFEEPEEAPQTSKLEEKLQKLNAGVNALDFDGDFYAVAYRTDDNYLDFAVAVWPEKVTVPIIKKKLEGAVKSLYGVPEAKVSDVCEITAKNFTMMLEEADNRDYTKRSARRTGLDLDLNYFNNGFFRLDEIMSLSGPLTKKEALEKAKSIMADESLYEEIDRIYAKENLRKFYGYPVHYKIQAGSRETGMAIINLMVRMLHSQGRIRSSRINHISEIAEESFDECDLENLCKHADGSAVVIEMRGSEGNHGNFATSYERVIRFLADLVKKYHTSTLFFFLEDIVSPGFTKELLAKAVEYVDIIDLKEGHGTREEAIEYFKQLVKDHSLADLADDDIEEYLAQKRMTFGCHDIHDAYNKWSRDVLRDKAYGAYKKCNILKKKIEKKKGSSYEELQDMVGLSEVKNLADQIIASYKMQSIRDDYGFKESTFCRHMVFTGNPGSAKTTVARLLADTLTEEGILKTGCLVECGRSDLVGKFVGWTAREVRDKFKEAEGGILFIDEAYSLVDDSRSFGDEAINTIVQEMENRRNSVIVIFAGYPDKMKEFLDKNEGLRSRIAYHLDFPDYNADELLQIMELMLKKQGLRVDQESRDKCLAVFQDVCKEKDFGNGRFVRNYIEHAMLRQAERLIKPGKNAKPSKAMVSKLTANDFEIDISQMVKKEKRKTIGFNVA